MAKKPKGTIMARVTITRVLDGSDVVDHVVAADSEGYALGLADALGMLRLAEHTLIATYEADE